MSLSGKSFIECLLGDPSEVRVAGVNIGSTRNTQIGMEMQYSEFYSAAEGGIQVRRGKKKVRDSVKISTELYEIKRILAWLYAMGMAEDILSNSAGSAVTTYWQNPTAWQASHAYTSGLFVEPTTLNGYIYECTTAGTSDSSEPSWPTTVGNTVVDGTATWTCRAYATESCTFAPYQEESLNYIQLTGYNLDSATTPIVYNSGHTAKIAAAGNWYVDKVNGEIKQILDGSIGDTDTVKVAYKYAPINYDQLNLKPSDMKTLYRELEVRMVDPHATSGKPIHWVLFETLPKSGAKVQFDPENLSKLTLDDISCRKDAERPNYEYGYIFWGSAAA